MAYCAYCGAQVAAVSYQPCPACGNPSNGAPRPQLSTGGSNAAVIAIAAVIGGLVIVAIIGILAAIAIPNLLTAMQRSKQKRTMADMRSISTALEAHASDKRLYPDALDALSPTYIKQVPRKDGWGSDFRYECWPAGQCTAYALASAGKDGKFEHGSLQEYTQGATTKFDCDLVYANGAFVQYPEGASR